MEKKKCELCDLLPARAHCDSDEASLCWDCDAKVHGANFLVARHLRSILCSSCHHPTPSKASGPRLPSSTAQLCRECLFLERCKTAENEEEEEDEGENQVVLPLSLAAIGEKGATTATSWRSSTSSEELSSTCGKRRARRSFDFDLSAISTSPQREESGAYHSANDGEDEVTSWRSSLSTVGKGRRKIMRLFGSCLSSS